ncbi:hypothetical protein B0T20DRAFT_507018 [Sordaria brevicollis]|uniref:Uncharacterized protein n=1 Tax=Sordaria brevicollis TaxID=83679 RepID=A0AAE0PEK2_SORBR|nr:hypothetical protein B0T20DRAFT_507018 [Sordaria brevicollis]
MKTTAQRPSTAGTEAALRLSRHHAAEALKQARRAERAYTSRKRAKLARANRAEAAEHFRQAKGHTKLAVGLGWGWVKGWRYLVLEGWEDMKFKRDESNRKRKDGAKVKRVGEENMEEQKEKGWGKGWGTGKQGEKGAVGKRKWGRKGKEVKGNGVVEETVREVDGSGSDESEDESVRERRRRERKWGKRREKDEQEEVDESERSESEDERRMSDDESDCDQRRRSRRKSRRSRDEKV